MPLSTLLLKPLRNLLASHGYHHLREGDLPPRWEMEGALKALAARRIVVNTVVDIGASNGEWSAPCMALFPEAAYLLIEAQPCHEQELAEFARSHASTHVVMAAAGAERGTIYFDVTDPMGGQASYAPYEKHNAVVPVTTVDYEVAHRNLHGPFLLKFDTHGFEVPILNGAQETLKATAAIVMECYNFKIAEECLLFWEMCDRLHKAGFRPIDLVALSHRAHDDALWQMDIVFVRDDRPEFQYSSYR